MIGCSVRTIRSRTTVHPRTVHLRTIHLQSVHLQSVHLPYNSPSGFRITHLPDNALRNNSPPEPFVHGLLTCQTMRSVTKHHLNHLFMYIVQLSSRTSYLADNLHTPPGQLTSRITYTSWKTYLADNLHLPDSYRAVILWAILQLSR